MHEPVPPLSFLLHMLCLHADPEQSFLSLHPHTPPPVTLWQAPPGLQVEEQSLHEPPPYPHWLSLLPSLHVPELQQPVLQSAGPPHFVPHMPPMHA
jgi:hypothetical protein